jgi:tetratricopeptide (TPR) repeat protein
MRRFGLFASVEPFAAPYAGWYFFWAALGHSIQYVWVTSYFARSAAGFPGLMPYLTKALFAGTAIWGLPALLFAPGVLGRVPYDAGLGALIASVVNLHHFVLDGAIWKLRDGRIARILVRSEASSSGAAIGVPRRRWLQPALLGIGALCCASLVFAEFETEFGLRRAYARADFGRMRTALQRLDWIGRDSATNHLAVARIQAVHGQNASAIREFQKSLRLFPTPDAWVGLAELFEKLGLLTEARDAYDNAIDVAPDSAPIAYRGAALAIKLRDTERARTLLERAVAIDPDKKLYRVALDNLNERSSDSPPETPPLEAP